MRQRDIFWFWLPLFTSWLLMAAEGPIISAAINRLPEEVIMLAAQGIVLSLSVTIESPIINILATSTALVRDRASYLLIRRFTLHWILLLTAVAMLVGYTPLFDFVVIRLMATPVNVASWVRLGLRIMLLWTAAIAWRRFLQGVLIRYGQTNRIAWGTAIRLVASGGAAVVLALWSDWPGVAIGATALMAGVLAEAAFASLAVRPLLRHELGPVSPAAPGKPLTYGDLFWFHLPLAGTSVLTLLVQPMVAFSLARLARPTESLAAWPLVFQVSLMTRAAAFALPEAVIALTQGPESYAPVRRFSLILALLSLVGMAGLIFSPLLPFYLFTVQDTTATVGGLAQIGVSLMLLLPAGATLVAWLRGQLIHQRATTTINVGMAINLAVTAAVLAAGTLSDSPGTALAVAALNTAIAVELLFLFWRKRQLARSDPGRVTWALPLAPSPAEAVERPSST